MQRPWSTPVSRGEKTRSQWVSKCVIFRLSRHVSISEEYNMKRMKLLPAYIVCLQITSVSYVSGQNCKSGSKNCNNVIMERDCYCCQGQYKYEDYYGYHSRYTCFECPIGEYMISDYHILQGCISCPRPWANTTLAPCRDLHCDRIRIEEVRHRQGN